jgi:hypothetical protein
MGGHPTIRRSLVVVLAVPLLALSGCTDTPTAATPDAATLATARRAPNQPVRLEFEKCAISEGVWKGTVTGDISGRLRTELTELRVTGPIWHVRFDWIIRADDPLKSFVADLRGILNTNTGRVVMNGRVREGYLRGAQVHEEGQLVSDPLCFEGAIRIMPATAR